MAEDVLVGDNVADDPLVKKSPALAAASTAATALVGDDPSDEDRDRIFAHNARPYTTALGKEKENLNKYYESQGLRFSTERRDDILEATDKTFTAIGESVMVPQIEREAADRRANITTAANVGQIEGQIDYQNATLDQADTEMFGATKATRRKTRDDLNAALERAATNGRENGEFTDPVTGQSYEDLAASMQQVGTTIGNRKTTVLEADAAMQRAEARGRATGVFIDPITGESIETLEKRRTDIEERVQRASQTGLWFEPGVEVNTIEMMEFLGIDPEDYLGEGTGEEGDLVLGDRTVDTVIAEIQEIESETQFLQTVPTWSARMGIDNDALLAVVNAIGVDESQALFHHLSTGQEMPLETLLAMFQTDPEDNLHDGFFLFMDTMEQWLTTSNVTDDPSTTMITLKDGAVGSDWKDATTALRADTGIPKALWDRMSNNDKLALQKHPNFKLLATPEDPPPGDDDDDGGDTTINSLSSALFPVERLLGRQLNHGAELTIADKNALMAAGHTAALDWLFENGYVKSAQGITAPESRDLVQGAYNTWSGDTVNALAQAVAAGNIAPHQLETYWKPTHSRYKHIMARAETYR